MTTNDAVELENNIGGTEIKESLQHIMEILDLANEIEVTNVSFC